ADFENNALPLGNREAVRAGGNGISSWREIGEAVITASIGFRGLGAYHCGAGDGNVCAGNHCTGRILHGALKTTCGLLAENGGGKQQQRKYLQQSEQRSILIVHRILQQGRLVVSGKSWNCVHSSER